MEKHGEKPGLFSGKSFLIVFSQTIACLFFCLFTFSCSSKPDVDLIFEIIDQAAKLAEAHDLKGIANLTTDDFYAMPGRRNRQETKKILWWAFKQYQSFQVLYPKPAVDLDKTNTIAYCNVYFMIVRQEKTFPGLEELYHDPEAWIEKVGRNADLYRLKLDFVKTDNDWLVKSALLEPFKGLGFD